MVAGHDSTGLRMPSPQYKYFLLTIPHADFLPYLPNGISYITGQLERGGNTGYLHWQLLIHSKSKCTVTKIKSIFGDTTHVEPTRSAAAEQYVHKADTAVEGTSFQLGEKSFKRNSSTDWERIRNEARLGRLDNIDADVYIRHYSSLKRIAADHMEPVAVERQVKVFWGATGTGKSRTAWSEAGLDAYPKDPRSKFWDGYRGQLNVVLDEFRGGIDISHILRWLNRYPVIVEIKGSSVVLKATNIWITSNLHPRDWYPDLDEETKSALLRRLTITHFENPFDQ